MNSLPILTDACLGFWRLECFPVVARLVLWLSLLQCGSTGVPLAPLPSLAKLRPFLFLSVTPLKTLQFFFLKEQTKRNTFEPIGARDLPCPGKYKTYGVMHNLCLGGFQEV